MFPDLKIDLSGLSPHFRSRPCNIIYILQQHLPRHFICPKIWMKSWKKRRPCPELLEILIWTNLLELFCRNEVDEYEMIHFEGFSKSYHRKVDFRSALWKSIFARVEKGQFFYQNFNIFVDASDWSLKIENLFQSNSNLLFNNRTG